MGLCRAARQASVCSLELGRLADQLFWKACPALLSGSKKLESVLCVLCTPRSLGTQTVVAGHCRVVWAQSPFWPLEKGKGLESDTAAGFWGCWGGEWPPLSTPALTAELSFQAAEPEQTGQNSLDTAVWFISSHWHQPKSAREATGQQCQEHRCLSSAPDAAAPRLFLS